MNLFEVSLDYTLLAALLLAVVHLLGPNIRQGMQRRTEAVTSFGGGLAVAYVFLQLFPEIEMAHEWLGDSVHFVTLASFLLFFVLEVRLLTHHERSISKAGAAPVSGGDQGAASQHMNHTSTSVFWWHIALIWLYTWMVIFALPEETGENLAFAIVGTLAVGLHMIYKDFVLRAHHEVHFASRGRYLLAIAPIAGWVAHKIAAPPEFVFDLFIAVLAGILMQGVFREELPDRQTARVGWLIGGAATFALLSLLTA